MDTPNAMVMFKKKYHSHLLWFVGFYAFLLLGCASIIRGPTKAPDILIVRNNSGVEIMTVTLQSADSPDRQKRRYGAISPVPRGASQVFPRPTSAPPLPKRLLISWVTHDAVFHSRKISLAQALGSSPDPKANTIVFEILAGDLVNVYWEVSSGSRIK